MLGDRETFNVPGNFRDRRLVYEGYVPEILKISKKTGGADETEGDKNHKKR